MSTHRVDVVPVALERHPNADALSVVRAFGFQVCVRTEDWLDKTSGAYIPPDSLVDVRRPEFSFLAEQAKSNGFARIQAKKLRGVVSFGLLVPAPPGVAVGDDLAEALGVTHYEPPLAHDGSGKLFMGGEVATAPNVFAVKYDIDNLRRYHTLIEPGEAVYVSEKLDGCNARYVFADGSMHCGSRTEWKKEFPDYAHITVEGLIEKGMAADRAQEVAERLHSRPKRRNLWWEMLEKTPAIGRFCQAHPGTVLYGEIFGNVNCIKYGLPEGNRFAAFDMLRDGQWLLAGQALVLADAFEVPWVPVIHPSLAYDFEQACALAEGPTLVPDAKPGTIREGCVIKPIQERIDPHLGRVVLKLVSSDYLERY